MVFVEDRGYEYYLENLAEWKTALGLIGLFGGSPNTYLYVSDNPLALIDADGLKPVDDRRFKFKPCIPVCLSFELRAENMDLELSGADEKRNSALEAIGYACDSGYEACSQNNPCGGESLSECIEQLTKDCQEKRDDVWDAWEDRREGIQGMYGISSALKRLCDSKSSVGL